MARGLVSSLLEPSRFYRVIEFHLTQVAHRGAPAS